MNSLFPARASLLAAVLLTGLAALPIQAGPKLYPFGSFVPPPAARTLTDRFKTADFVIVTHVMKDSPGELAIDEIVKPHEVLKGKNTFIPNRDRNSPISASPLVQFIGFGDNLIFANNEKTDLFLMEQGPAFSPDGILKNYFFGALKLKDAKCGERLRFCLDYLECKDADVAHDAFKELDKAPIKELMALAKTMPPKKLSGWLRDPAVPPDHQALYAFMLGNCGTVQHAGLLRHGAEEALKRKDYDSALPYLIGHVMLQPKEGWAFVRTFLEKDCSLNKIEKRLAEKVGQFEDETWACYCALYVADFIREERAGLIDSRELNAGIARQLDNYGRRWLAVECLRKAKCWDLSKKVVAAHRSSKLDPHEVELANLTAVLRFCLQSPEPAAVAFVKKKRESDAKLVSEVENQLKAGK